MSIESAQQSAPTIIDFSGVTVIGLGAAVVTSVFTRTGAVIAQAGDYDFPKISGNITAGQLPVLGIPNINLQNSQVTVNGTANRLTGGGVVALGGTIALNLDTLLFPSPVGGDVGKFYKVTAANQGSFFNIAETDVTNLVSDLNARALDNAVLHLAGAFENVTVQKAFSGGIVGGSNNNSVLALLPTSHGTPIDAAQITLSIAALQFSVRPYSTDSATGRAILYLQPTFDLNRTIGFYSKAQTFGTTTGGTSNFYAHFNGQFMSVPSGVKGQLSIFEGTIDTGQAASDLAASETGHIFGGTVIITNGCPTSVLDGVITINTVQVSSTLGAFVMNLAVINNVAGSVCGGIDIESGGSQSATSAIRVSSGTFVTGLDLAAGANYSSVGILLKNNSALGWKTSGGSVAPAQFLNAADQMEFAVTTILLNQANPAINMGSPTVGWLFQKVDADNRLRIYSLNLAAEIFAISATTGNITISGALSMGASLALTTAGAKISIKEGANASLGVATLVAGTVVVNTNLVTANSRIFLQGQNSSGTHGELTISARTAGTSFTITSSNAADTRSVAWHIVEPA